MRYHRTLISFFASLALLGVGVTQDQATPPQQEPLSLGEIARRYQQQKQAQGAVPSQQATGSLKTASKMSDDEDLYKAQIQQLLSQRNFAELEKSADEDRRTKARFAGGVWKLYVFYDAFTQPATSGHPTMTDWNVLFSTLKEWTEAKPESITAPVALARAYIGYAAEARGSGFADTVTETGWKLHDERTEQARQILIKAAKLKRRCPFWYQAMQNVAMSQGWEKSEAKALFDQAVAFEPDYYHYYREYINFLLPKWYGEDGEAEQFANEIAGRMTGDQGDFLYFEMASAINCQCGNNEDHMANLSWPRIKRGYEVLQRLYGTSNLKDNRFAYMAFLAQDKSAAQEAFMRIGQGWNPYAWRNRQYFDAVKAWASR